MQKHKTHAGDVIDEGYCGIRNAVNNTFRVSLTDKDYNGDATLYDVCYTPLLKQVSEILMTM